MCIRDRPWALLCTTSLSPLTPGSRRKVPRRQCLRPAMNLGGCSGETLRSGLGSKPASPVCACTEPGATRLGAASTAPAPDSSSRRRNRSTAPPRDIRVRQDHVGTSAATLAAREANPLIGSIPQPARERLMSKLVRQPPVSISVPVRVAAVGAVAIGAVAVGALALGALAIGRLAVGGAAVGRAAVGRLRLGAVEIESLTVRRLTVLEPGASEGGRSASTAG